MGQDYNLCSHCGDIFGDYSDFYHCEGCESYFCYRCVNEIEDSEKTEDDFVFDKYGHGVIICYYCNEEGGDRQNSKKIFEVVERTLEKETVLDGTYAKMKRENPEEYLETITLSASDEEEKEE